MLPDAFMLEPFIACLGQVAQDPVHHGEGDVLTHTRLVLERLRELPEYAALDPEARTMMDAAACLHDLGKKACTVEVDGRLQAPNHSATGEKMARLLLMIRFDMGGTVDGLRAREAICQLVRCHMKPLHVLDGEEPERKARELASAGELAPGFTLERLAMLAQADQLGRICADRRELLNEIALFGMLAGEQQCFSRPYAYPDAHTRFADLSGRSVAPDQPLYNDTWGTVVMLSGLPGTGKDTYAARQLGDMPMVSLDALRLEMRVAATENQGRVVQAAQERCREHLRRHEPFVFNATNLSAMLRGKWLRLFHRYGASVRIVYLETAWRERERRNAGRKMAVPEEAVLKMAGNLEPPMLTEAEEVEWLCV